MKEIFFWRVGKFIKFLERRKELTVLSSFFGLWFVKVNSIPFVFPMHGRWCIHMGWDNKYEWTNGYSTRPTFLLSLPSDLPILLRWEIANFILHLYKLPFPFYVPFPFPSRVITAKVILLCRTQANYFPLMHVLCWYFVKEMKAEKGRQN